MSVLGVAHGFPRLSLPGVSSYRVAILSVARVDLPARYTAIEVAGDKRFVLADSILVHNCIRALDQGGKHLPFRGSQLTQVRSSDTRQAGRHQLLESLCSCRVPASFRGAEQHLMTTLMLWHPV